MWVQVEDKLKISFFVRKTYLLLNFLTLVSRCNIPVATTTCKTIQKVALIVKCVCDDLCELELPMATPTEYHQALPIYQKITENEVLGNQSWHDLGQCRA